MVTHLKLMMENMMIRRNQIFPDLVHLLALVIFPWTEGKYAVHMQQHLLL